MLKQINALTFQTTFLFVSVLIFTAPLVAWIFFKHTNNWESKYILSIKSVDLDYSKSGWKQHSNSLESVFSADKYVFKMADEAVYFLRALQKSKIGNENELANLSINFLLDLGERELDPASDPKILADEDYLIRSLIMKWLKSGTRNWIGSLGFFSKKIPSDLAIIFERESESSYALTINFFGNPQSMIALSYALLVGFKKAFENFNADLKITILDSEQEIATEVMQVLNDANVFYESQNPEAVKAISELKTFEKSFWEKTQKYLDRELILEFIRIEQIAEMNTYPADQYFSFFAGFLQRPLWRMCQVSNFILQKNPKADVYSCDYIYQQFNSTEVKHRNVLNSYFIAIDHAFKLIKHRSENLISLLGPSYLRDFELPTFYDYVNRGSYLGSMKRNFLRTYYLPAVTSLVMLFFFVIILLRKNLAPGKDID